MGGLSFLWVRAHIITPNSAWLAVSTQRRIRALYISTKEPYVYPQKSPTYIHKKALCMSTNEPCIYPQKSPTHIRQRALYISTKEPWTYPQKSPIYVCKRALYISTKEPYTYLQKIPTHHLALPQSHSGAFSQHLFSPSWFAFFFFLEHTGWRHTSHR